MNPEHEQFFADDAICILDTLQYWSRVAPDKAAICVLGDGENVSAQLDFRTLYADVLRLREYFRSRYAAGARLMLLLPTCIEFAPVFFAAMAAGLVPVPSTLQSMRPNHVRKLAAIFANSGAQVLVTTAEIGAGMAMMRSQIAELATTDILSIEELAQQQPAVNEEPHCKINPDSLAFLQYTSGSTGLPKGVMLTHRNIINNQRVIVAGMDNRHEDIVLAWLPLHHDMGLSLIFQAAYTGTTAILLPPQVFIRRPMCWVRAISQHRATVSVAPNFAYEMLLPELQKLQPGDLDLSCWKVAGCGAEPIQQKTITGFAAAAGRFGFRADSFFPCYGLAESTVKASSLQRDDPVRYLHVDTALLEQGEVETVAEGAANSRTLISCGVAHAGNRILVVNVTTGMPCVDNQIGEIWLQGDSVGVGYWNNEEASRETFQARLADGSGPFLRSGDLGVLVGGELYVTGRVKDLIIIRGRNLYPQDIEESVQQNVAGLRRHFGVAFGVRLDDSERLIIAQELEKSLPEDFSHADACRKIVSAVVDDHGVTPHEVLLLKPSTLEKTSSGKVQRAPTKRQYGEDQLQILFRWTNPLPDVTAEPAPVSSSKPGLRGGADHKQMVRTIVGVVAAFTRVSPDTISTDTAWTEMGLDSLQAVKLVELIQQRTGVALEPTVVWQCSSIDELARHILLALGQQTGLQTGTSATGAVRPAQAAPYVAAALAPPLSDQELNALSEAEATALLLDEIAR